MKLLYVQDLHIRGKNSRYRIGNYYQCMLDKLEEIIEIAKSNEVKYIIDGGDFFDTSLVSNTIIDDILDRIEEAKIFWYMIWGNHTEEGNNPELSKSTSLAHMFRRSKYVKHLDSLKLSVCFIKGFDYCHGIEKDVKENGLITDSESDFKIAVIHAFITLKPFLEKVLHIQAKNIKTNFDLVMCAHYHQPWGIKEINNTKFINYGCIGRLDKNEKDINPTVVLIDTKTKELTPIVLKNIKPIEEIFDLEKIEIDETNKITIDNFVSALQNTKIQGMNLRGQVEFVCKENNIDDEVKNSIITKISEFEDKEDKT